MTDSRSAKRCDIGMVGLGVMGRNFVLNMADNGFSVAGYDLDEDKVSALREAAQEGRSKPSAACRTSSRCSMCRAP